MSDPSQIVLKAGEELVHAHVPSGASPLSPVVACPAAGVKVINNVAHLLAISPVLVTVVVVLACTILGVDRVIGESDVVTVLLAAIGAHQAVVAAQSLKKSG